MFMQSIRRSTKRHRKVLFGVVILLMLGLVGSFATWNSGSNTLASTDSPTLTLEEQIANVESNIDNLLMEYSAQPPDYSASMTLGGQYLDLSYLYYNKANEDISTAEAAASLAAEANPDAEPIDTSTAGEAAMNSRLEAAQQSQVYYQQAWDNVPEDLNEAGRAEIKAGLAASREAQDDLEGALAFMAEAYELNPTNTQYIVAQASLLETLGRPEEALAMYQTASAMYPENTQLMVAQAALHAELDQGEEARDLYLKACELAPEDLNITYAYASFLFSYESPEAGLNVLKAFRDSLPAGHASIAGADNAIANLQGWADFFAGLNSGAETEEGAEGAETPAEETPAAEAPVE